MKQLGNLAIVCARRSNVLLHVLDCKATVHTGEGSERRAFTMNWDDDEKINKLIYELNFGELSEKGVNHDAKY
jgi:hypothetical protein